MMKEMKQNKNSSVFLHVFCFTLVFVVLFCSLSFPSFAYTDTSTNGVDFSSSPLAVTSDFSYSNVSSIGLLIGSNNNRIYFYAVSSNDSSVYASLIPYNGDFYPVFASPNSGAVVKYLDYDNVTSSSSTYNISLSTFDSSTSLYYNAPGGGSLSIPWSAGPDIPTFSNSSSALSAVRDWIDNPPFPGSSPHSISKDLPCGNAVFIDVTGVSSFNLSLSQTTEVAQPQTFYNNQYYGYSDSLPASFSGNPSGSSTITWYGYGNKTLFNRYTHFSWSLYNASNNHKYIFIVNPYATIDEYNQSFNSTIYFSIDNAVGYQYYELTGGIGTDGTIGQQTNGTTASGHYNDATGEWETVNNDTGLPWSPSEGGGNLITTNSVNDWLRTIATQISNFFQGAIGAVTTLVSAGTDFIHSLSGLYSWLPGPVYSVLVSALILVITIGVIKVFI